VRLNWAEPSQRVWVNFLCVWIQSYSSLSKYGNRNESITKFGNHNVLRLRKTRHTRLWRKAHATLQCFKPGVSKLFLSKGHISVCTTVRGADILRMFLDVLKCTVPNEQFFRKYIIFFVMQKTSLRLDEIASRAGWNDFAGRIWPADRSLETPALS